MSAAPANDAWVDTPNRKARRQAKRERVAGSGGSESESEASDGGGSPKKGKRAAAAKDEDPLANAGKTDTRHIPMFATMALILSVAPAYLYANVYDLPFTDYPLLYLIAIGSSAGALTYSFQIAYLHHNSILLSQRKGSLSNSKLQKELGYSAKDLEKISAHATSQESAYYAMLFTNALYLVVWFFLAFYMLRDVAVSWNYVLSQVLTAAATYMISQTMSK